LAFVLKAERSRFRSVAYPGILFEEGSSKNSVEDRGQTERGFGGGSSLARGFTQFANE
jgi:hypothetical protein